MAVIEIGVQDFLPLGQSDTHRPTAESVSHSLPLSQLARTQIQAAVAQSLFNPLQTIGLQRSIRNLSIAQSFIMYQQGAPLAGTESLIDIFFMWQQARLVEYEQVSHTLNLTQSVTVVTAKAATNTLDITHTASCVSIRTRTATNTFAPQSKASAYMDDKYSYSIVLPTLTGPNAPEC